MNQIDLPEYASKQRCLTDAQRDALISLKIEGARDRQGKPELKRVLGVEPKIGEARRYVLTSNSIVGALEVENLSLLIEPKIGIPQLLSLVSYAMGLFRQQDDLSFNFEEAKALPDVLALALVSAANRAFARGLLHGYRTEEEALYTVRGRIRFDEQIRRRFSVPLPVEVRYDEFTDDILANRLVKAAAYRLRGMRLRSTPARQGLARVAGILDNVSLKEFPRNDVPKVQFDRLNEHYRVVVELSRLILRHSAFESGRGEVRATGFLMDMNEVFQEFVTQALREALGVPEWEFGEMWNSLDEGGKVWLRPDLTWWDGKDYRFVGDVKYRIDDRNRNDRNRNDDLYQLLAYVTALDLPGGMLIYAKGEADPYEYKVRHSGKTLEVVALDLAPPDLAHPLDRILKQVEDLAKRVRTPSDQS